MNKTWLIIKREYITRVRNKTFIISTFLTPLFFVGLIAAIIYIFPKGNVMPSTLDRFSYCERKHCKKRKVGHSIWLSVIIFVPDLHYYLYIWYDGDARRFGRKNKSYCRDHYFIR